MATAELVKVMIKLFLILLRLHDLKYRVAVSMCIVFVGKPVQFVCLQFCVYRGLFIVTSKPSFCPNSPFYSYPMDV